ncbi:hypothetical protein E1B28_002857 [Marasmius oreades]|uniref:Uncharacterized protein n=1 Tax=Marasmius oreades TaxID=181124 RepID=A0A9P7RNW2_9AGAR|nr:uncharacterized protein E1B28_002857 [Marasmius oreades]KAG7086940.1 hypothetical protein E1B28_002857 [Marasmius oreades]
METNHLSIGTLWVPLQLTSLAGIIVIQLTTSFGHLVRGRVWYGFMISLAIFSLSTCLLYISGQRPTNKQQAPNHLICLAQAVLMYSIEPLSFAMLLSLFIKVKCLTTTIDTRTNDWFSELYSQIRSSTRSQNRETLEKRAGSPLLLIFPYGSWCLLVITYITFGLLNPSKVIFDHAQNLYCVFDDRVIRTFNCIVSGILSQAIMSVVGMVVVRLVMINNQSAPHALPCLREYTILFIRFALIWIGSLVSVVITIIFAIQENTPPIYHVIAQAGVPLVVTIVFGSQKDVWLVWRDLVRGFLGRLGIFRAAPTTVPTDLHKHEG